MRTFDELQSGLGSVLALHDELGRSEHVVVVLPSLSLTSRVAHNRLAGLEHRFLTRVTMLRRLPHCEVILVMSVAPDPQVWDYHLDLAAPFDRAEVARRAHLVSLDDATPRPLASKLLGRHDLLDRIRGLIAGRPAFIEPYIVTDAEAQLAVRLQVPVNGAPPWLAPLGYKSGSRRVFAEAGILTPTGREDVCTVDAVIEAAREVRATRPEARAIVVKLDNGASGHGNALLHLPAGDDVEAETHLRGQMGDLPPWYVSELAAGAVVEEHVVGERFTSPSVQVDIEPGGCVRIRGTHEQDLGGPLGHTYEGCRFPADPAYSWLLVEQAEAVGRVLARRGVVGRFSLDFAVTWQPERGWAAYALEINLRQGATTPPLSLLRNLDPGLYHPDPGRWLNAAGGMRCYRSTDNLADPRWVSLEPGRVIHAVREAGLGWDHSRRSGVVLHLLSALAIEGRIGLTAIAATLHEADALHGDVVGVLHGLTAAVGPAQGLSAASIPTPATRLPTAYAGDWPPAAATAPSPASLPPLPVARRGGRPVSPQPSALT